MSRKRRRLISAIVVLWAAAVWFCNFHFAISMNPDRRWQPYGIEWGLAVGDSFGVNADVYATDRNALRCWKFECRIRTEPKSSLTRYREFELGGFDNKCGWTEYTLSR